MGSSLLDPALQAWRQRLSSLHRALIVLSATIVLGALASSCTDQSPVQPGMGVPGGNNGGNNGAGQPRSASITPASGGTVTAVAANGNKLTVTVPPGAVSQPTTLTLTPLSQSQLPVSITTGATTQSRALLTPNPNNRFVAAYSLVTSPPTTFSKPLQFTLSIPSCSGISPNSPINVAQLDNGQWYDITTGLILGTCTDVHQGGSGVFATGVTGTFFPTSGFTGNSDFVFYQPGAAGSGLLAYTNFSNTGVKKLPYSIDSTGKIVLGAPTLIAATNGADGAIESNNRTLLVAGQGAGNIYEVDPNTGTVRKVNATPLPQGAYHMTLDPSGTSVWSAGLFNNALDETNLSTGAVSHHNVSNVNNIAGIIFFGSKLYIADNANPATSGNGELSTVDLNTFKATPVVQHLNSAHGLVYDSYTQHILMVATSWVGEFNPLTGSLVGHEIQIPGANYMDQGVTDGYGHLYAADAAGNLVYVNYSSSHQLDSSSNVVQVLPVEANMDDIAVLSLPQGTSGTSSSGSASKA